MKTYDAIIKDDKIPEPGIPESFKVLLKELQSLGLDVRVLREDNTEVEIMETIDYGDTDYRYEIEGEDRNYDYDKGSFGSMGYQQQEFDEDSGELISADEEEEEELDDSFEDDFDEVLDEDSFEI